MKDELTHSLLRLPRVQAIALVVAVSVLASDLLTIAFCAYIFDSPRALIAGLVISTVIPLAVATPVAGVILTLMHRLDAARREADLLASMDYLTGALNRRHFLDAAKRELARSQHTAAPLSVLMLDVDDFKTVNDRAGHDVGDEVLRTVAHACRDAMRPGDLLARWGGEEFVALLPGAGAREAIAIGRRLCVAVAAIGVPSAPGTQRVTASLGVASSLEPDEPLDAIIARADRAMYEAKRRGKNGVVHDTVALSS